MSCNQIDQSIRDLDREKCPELKNNIVKGG
jgi:hypothetical protein